MNDKAKGSMVALLIAGLVLGGVGGYAIGNSGTDDDHEHTETTSESAGVNSPAADLRVGLNNALREHVSLAGAALRNVFDGSADTDASVTALDENSKEVAGLVGSVYGQDAEDSFLELWRQHIVFFANYTSSAKASDQAGMDKALEDLAGYGEAASTFFANANPNLPKDAVKPLLLEHRNLVIDTVNAYGAGDYTTSYQKETEAIDQVAKIADALADGIAAQYPDMF